MRKDNFEKWNVPAELQKKMSDLAGQLRRNHTPSEDLLWQALRNRQLKGRKFRRQVPIGAFIVDFYCPSERLVVEVDGSIHDDQQEADSERQTLIESLGIRFVRVTSDDVINSLGEVLEKLTSEFQDL